MELQVGDPKDQIADYANAAPPIPNLSPAGGWAKDQLRNSIRYVSMW